MLASPFVLLLLGTSVPLVVSNPLNVLVANGTLNNTQTSSSEAETAVTFSDRPALNISSHHTSNITYISPQVPAPLKATHANPSSKWDEAHDRARSYLSKWTVAEKVSLTTGLGWQQGRLASGVRSTDYVSAFPAGINAAATFDKDLIYSRGYAMGQEFKGKGAHVALGPMTNMGRVAAAGRNWEGFGGDPYLSGWATDATVRGLQDAGVQACVKHFVSNEQERNRTTSSSNIDDRTLREIYTHPFLRAVQAEVASVMCSYNLVNGSWACENPKTTPAM
ncbi:hypothetical protein L198_04718 [Cryptococcus wingfieldii CBS 7118]|uniref:beta-glucosidase n=1 Tax=Cryptococcus wingfieldii CBS 7118 TaxID=1295528 RepID=A0A1E3J3A0_9TREE|nr:hypothetical protein L198_04718 [Cryptococcus wingfieldii CBS 7118]ODN95322.1 hypothetical protein L198_04718 [Cryptococcus wingfieldii CBS 7118]